MFQPITRRSRRHDDGFTLIELLVVVIILGILSAVVVFAVRGTSNEGDANARATDGRIVRTALEAYCARYGEYPKAVPPDDAMDELVDKEFLSNRSDYTTLETGRPAGAPGVQGNCAGGGYELGTGGGGTAGERCNGQPWAVGTWCRTAPPFAGVGPPFTDAPSGGGPSQEEPGRKLVQLLDGRIFTGWGIFDPATGTWTRPTPPKDYSLFVNELAGQNIEVADESAGYFQPSEMVLLRDDPATLDNNECSPNCGKVIVGFGSGWEIFDPSVVVNGQVGSWTIMNPGLGEGSRAIQITGTLAECGGNCGKVLAAGKYGPNRYDVQGAHATLYDHRTGTSVFAGYYTVPTGFNRSKVWMASLPRGQVLVMTTDGTAVQNCLCFRALVYDSLTGILSEVDPPPAPGHEPLPYSPGDSYNPAVFMKGSPAILSDSRVVFTRTMNTSIFQPTDSSWAEAPACPAVGGCSAITALLNGKVLAVESDRSEPAGAPNATWLFDPETNLWSQVPNSPPVFPAGGILISGDACNTNCDKILGVSHVAYSVSSDPAKKQAFKDRYPPRAWLYKAGS